MKTNPFFMSAENIKIITATLAQRIKRTPTIESFRFKPQLKVDFIPGQFLQVLFDANNPQNRESNKYLSFSSSPTKGYIEVTKRLSKSLFSQNLRNLNPGDKVLFELPMGMCVFKEEYKKIGFVTGGIGITPAISIIEYIVERGMDTDTILLYSNRTEDDIAFKKELDYWQSQTHNIKVHYTITDCQPKDKSCTYGDINKDLLLEKMADLDARVVFIFGPPKMVEAMNNVCIEAGCRKENTKTERFTGY
ncbi:MAG: FAD-dependent oxidoreductase [Candidatus Omnitrophota bacterium]|nr:MAG: FAD-dependent oxidoreductase [Candidatus Omnitrophota bacterium]